MIGADIREPNTPPLVMVKLPPVRSSTVSLPSRPLTASSLISSRCLPCPGYRHHAEPRHQAARRRNRHTDVEIVVVDHIIAVDRRIHFRVTFQGFNHRFHVEGHKAQTNAGVFKRFHRTASRRSIIGFMLTSVERGRHGGGVFRFQQTLCHTLTQASHRHTFFATCSQGRLRRRSSRFAGADSFAGAFARCFSTSSRVRRPPTPVPLIALASRLCSASRRRDRRA